MSEIAAVKLANEYQWSQGTNYFQWVMYFHSKTKLVYLSVTTESDELGYPMLVKIC